MPDTANQKFKITVPITRCYLRKSADGTEKYVVEGMASNTDLDLTGERMAEAAIKSMAKSLQVHPVIFKNEHGENWDDEFGEVTALYPTDDHRLMMEAELEPDHYRTKTLVSALEKGKQLGLSIGGLVVEASYEWLADLGRKVKTYTAIDLEEISVTGSPAVADTWLTNINKSVKDWKESPMPKDLKKTEEVEQPEVETPAEVPTEVDTPAEVTDETPEVTEETTTEEVKAPVEPEAVEQKDEVPAEETPSEDAAKSAPAQATDDTSTIAKAALLGSWAEADMADGAVSDITWNLRNFVWATVADTEKSAEDKQSLIDSALAEYSKLISTVCAALIASGSVDATTKSAITGESPEEVSKSLSTKDANIEELTKSLTAKSDEAEQLSKSLTEVKDELETIKGRKAMVVDKFATSDEAKSIDDEMAEKNKEFNRDFAKKFIGAY